MLFTSDPEDLGALLSLETCKLWITCILDGNDITLYKGQGSIKYGLMTGFGTWI